MPLILGLVSTVAAVVVLVVVTVLRRRRGDGLREAQQLAATLAVTSPRATPRRRPVGP